MLLTARQAADKLGVKLDTLYAYVSRGRLRSVTVSGTRERRYRSEDVEALLGGRSATRLPVGSDRPAVIPVIGSSICLIENGQFYYRGQNAVRLSATATLEDIARLLWLDEAEGDVDLAMVPASGAAVSGLIERCQIQLTALGDRDLSSLDLSRAGVIRSGWRILSALAASIAPTRPAPEPIHRAVAMIPGDEQPYPTAAR